MPKYTDGNPPMRRKRREGCKDQAYVCLNGQRVPLGPWGSKTAKQAYDRAIAEWLARGRIPAPPKDDALMIECVDVYVAHCAEYFKDSPKSRDRVNLAMRQLLAMYGRLPASKFGPTHLRAIRETMINSGLCLTTINTRVGVIKKMLRHCASLEMIPAEAWHKAATLENLKPGRTAAKQPKIVGPVSLSNIEAVKPFVTWSVRGMIELQLLTGARSGEICGLRASDIDMSGAVWKVTLARHKNAWRGKTRTLYIGPHGQQVLKPFILARGKDAYLFQPEDYYRERSQAGHCHRREGQKPNARLTDRRVTECYTPNTYRRAIDRACLQAGIPSWHPHQLRHTAATELAKQFSIDHVRAMLGHSHLDATQLYAQIDEAVVMKMVSAVG